MLIDVDFFFKIKISYLLFMRILLSYLFTINLASAQFGKINVTVDDRLLRSSERQKIAQINNDISRFFSIMHGMMITEI